MVSPDFDDAELGCLLDGHPDGGNGDARAGLDVAVEHLPRIHAIDVVGAEDEDVRRLLVIDDVEVLVDGVGRTQEPSPSPAHLRGHRSDVVADERRHAPRTGDVHVEAVALVLRENDDLAIAAVGEVGQREVDQPIAAGERYRRLGAIERERREPLAFTAREHHRQHAWAFEAILGHGVILPHPDRGCGRNMHLPAYVTH